MNKHSVEPIVDLTKIYEQTTKSQANAADPKTSAFVSANAGTGKTYILVNRVLRLLLRGNEPHKILCLTFTKAAAAEMENRLFETLAKWVTMPTKELLDQENNESLAKVLGCEPSTQEIELARRLFAKSIETPGGMKVQTIHSFCEKLLQRFPLEAEVPPHFKVLDETVASDILKHAMDQVLTKALKNPQSEESLALGKVISFSNDSQFESLVLNALRQKSIWGPLIAPDTNALIETLVTLLQLPENQSLTHWQERMATSVDDEVIKSLVPILNDEGSKRDQGLAQKLDEALQTKSPEHRIRTLQKAFLTDKNEPRSEKTLLTKAIKENYPALASQLYRAQGAYYEAFIAHESLMVADATKSLLILADKIITLYEQQKRIRAALDYQDLIEKTAELLSSRQNTAWVLYKLDQGLDHILVDEAQDTSPEQWQVITSLTEEFFFSEGARDAVIKTDKGSDGQQMFDRQIEERTIFAVGDEKQSIYGFQGAEPKQFSEMGEHFTKSAERANKNFKTIPLNLSFRSTSAVLNSVDLVFQKPHLRDCLTMSGAEITHYSNRQLETGLVEVWDTEKDEKIEKSEAFNPLEEGEAHNASGRCAEKIAKQIREWLDTGEVLASKGRPIEAGDILILVRKRAPFAPMIIRALKANNIPVAGADRIVITEQLAVMDMLALGDFLLLPEDDLALANLLKSPIFNLDDDDLFQLSHGRKGSLWQSLRYFAKREEKYNEVASQLSLWLSRADILPPFEFFANLLEGEGLRKKFIARLGAVAGDALDEFINLSLQYDELEPPSLQGFLSWLRRSGAEVKRDMEKGRNEVRVMTVHGAKGLEADIVFLPDTCSSKSASQSESLLKIKQPDLPESPKNKNLVSTTLWSLPNKSHLTPIKEARAAISEDAKSEQMRLLYVAMTRARDRLYVCGFEGTRGRSKDCWYNLIDDGLEGHLKEVKREDSTIVRQFHTGEQSKPTEIEQPSGTEKETTPLPEWAKTKALSEPVRTIPVAPSSVIPYETPDDDEDKLPIEPALISPKKMGDDGRFIRGRLVHKLLEYLPDVPEADRLKAAETLAKHHGRDLREQHQASIINETLAIINNPDYKDLFGPGSKAEVSLIARITPKKTGATPILLQGQIDRLVVREDEILIIDYKSNRPSPRKLEDVAEAYQAQLAAYRIALREIYPHHKLKSALLWTDGPYLMEIPDEMLDKYEAILNKE
ncbi:MAG: double-strand break repair helicase AddA [Methyloligella sp.]|nr:MAG: double-strand break repair helicase AddA [Methyloligella sp.]